MLQLDFSDPIHTMSILIIVVVLAIWIIAELRLEGGSKGVIRVISVVILSVMFMFLMLISGQIYF